MGTNRLRAAALCALAMTVVAGLAACGSGNVATGNSKSIQIWEGYTGVEAKVFARMITEYEKSHPGVKVNTLYVNSDNTLQKVQTAVAAAAPPDITSLYGSWAPNVAKISSGGHADQPGEEARGELERLLGRRARCRYRPTAG